MDTKISHELTLYFTTFVPIYNTTSSQDGDKNTLVLPIQISDTRLQRCCYTYPQCIRCEQYRRPL